MSDQEIRAMLIERKKQEFKKFKKQSDKEFMKEALIGCPLLLTSFVLFTYLVASMPV